MKREEEKRIKKKKIKDRKIGKVFKEIMKTTARRPLNRLRTDDLTTTGTLS